MLYMSGYVVTASILGKPDVGLLTMAEMVNQARNIVNATDLPPICDADTGYGNPINVIRTVKEYERVGVAGIHIEDQLMPKRCGHFEGKMVSFEMRNQVLGLDEIDQLQKQFTDS